VQAVHVGGGRRSREIISQYSMTWCKRKTHELVIGDHPRFLADTQEIFDMVLARIRDETEKLYPLVRKTQGDTEYAA
jgi:hypothetical protein